MQTRSSNWIVFVIVLASPAGLGAQATNDAPRFENDIQPIFSQYCLTCHGKSSPQLGLDLRTAATVMRGSHNGPVIVKGSPEQSLLWQKVSSGTMPPEAYKQKLPAQQKELIRKWIASGANANEAPVPQDEKAIEQAKRFANEILPILTTKCVQCHGKAQVAGLDLRTLDSVLRGSKSSPIVVDGSSEKSVLLRRVASGSMPPKGMGTPLTDSEIQSIRAWIDSGHLATAQSIENPLTRAFTSAEAPPLSDKDRQFWSFQPPVRINPPKVHAAGRVRTPIDAFLLTKLEEKGLTFAADASDATLLRRAYFDLTGLPPTPEQIRQFEADRKPGAYERLVDRLLSSPAYGERWGRHWLDAVGYVDTSGKDFDPKTPRLAEGMWRYRDYVIRSVNEDKPWDRFLTEQIAGDEIVDWRAAKQLDSRSASLLVATGYLRNILDNTGTDITNLPAERYEALFKLVEKVSSSTLGLTVGCARCHTHKFDPISQRDYYQFLALFTSAYNPAKWIPPQDRHLYLQTAEELKEIETSNKELDMSIAELNKQIEALEQPYRDRLLANKLSSAPEQIRNDLRATLSIATDKRDAVQKYLAEKFGEQLRIDTADLEKVLAADDLRTVRNLQEKSKTLDAYKRKPDTIQALYDVGPQPAIRLLQRGSVESPGPKVEPGFLSVISAGSQAKAVRPSDAQGDTTGLRLAFAHWLTDKANPLTSRVIVNRIWQHHLGAGIVATSDNFGRTGAAPTHPELLDWLAVSFRENGWSAKWLHKTIMLSTAYRQASQPASEQIRLQASKTDPDNALLWRANIRRLEAEALRDSIMSATGKLNASLGGPPVMTMAHPDGLITVSSKESEANQMRRSVYLLARRTYPVTFLGLFDFPIIDTNCTRRVPSATPLQSLTMMNDPFVTRAAREIAENILRLSGAEPNDDKLIETAYLILFARQPLKAEIDLANQHIQKQTQLYSRANAPSPEARKLALTSLSQVLISTNEFLYVN